MPASCDPNLAPACGSPDGKLVASGGDDAKLTVRRVKGGRVVSQWDHGKDVMACDFSKDAEYLVCGGCGGKGRGVGRYCSEACQAEHWPTHQEVCPRIDHASVEARPWLRKMQNYSLIDGVEKAKCAGHSPGDYLDVVAYELAEKYGTIDKMKMEHLSIEFVGLSSS